MKKVNVLITAGGTNEKVDEVRKITNMSTGALGVKMAEELINQKEVEINQIYYLCSKNAKQPNGDGITIIHVESTADLEREIKRLLTVEKIEYMIHSAAVSDYTTDYVASTKSLAEEIELTIGSYLYKVRNGNEMYNRINLQEHIEKVLQNPKKSRIDNKSKISSKNNQLLIGLKQTEKIISKIKEWSPRTFLVGFKLLNDVSEEELFDVAFQQLRKNRCNLVLANDLRLIREGEHTGMIVYPEKKHQLVRGKENIAKTLVETMFKRGETRYPNSVQKDSFNDISEKDYLSFYETGKTLFSKKLLPIVENGTYGNMSVKKEDKFYITGRNVQKGNLTKEMLVEIESVQELTKEEDEKVFAKVFYKGKVKPSIDTAIHHFIYKNTDYKAIIHVHTDKIFEGYPLTDYNYACGTEEEMISILNPLLVNKNQDIVQMNKHGIIVLGETLGECLAKLNELFEEKINIQAVELIKHENAWNEWIEHYHEIGIYDNLFDLTNPEKIFVISKGNAPVAALFLEENKTTYYFALYGLKEYQGKRLNIAQKTIDILQSLAKTKNINKLTLVTTEKCGVKDFYKNKHGFVQIPKILDTIFMVKEI